MHAAATDRPAPSSVNLVNQWLTSLPEIVAAVGRRVDYKLGKEFPAIRVTDVGVMDRGPEETLRRIQIEVWADENDFDTAEQLAALIAARAGTSAGTWPAGHCGGGSVESGPFYSPDQKSSRHRWQLDLALWLYPTDQP